MYFTLFVVVLLIVMRGEGMLSTEMVTGEAGLLTSTARGLQVSVRGSQLTALQQILLSC